MWITVCSFGWARKVGWEVERTDLKDRLQAWWSGCTTKLLPWPLVIYLNSDLENEKDAICHNSFEGFIHRNLLKTVLGNKQKPMEIQLLLEITAIKISSLLPLKILPPSPSSAPQPGAVAVSQRIEHQWWRGEVWALRGCRPPPVHLQQQWHLLLCNLNRYKWMVLIDHMTRQHTGTY